MRRLGKTECPKILQERQESWTKALLEDSDNKTNKYRYRHPDIKDRLRTETGNKCVYCESKVGHNTPGDVEHKVPSTAKPEAHFDWTNLTIACTECNRRKNDYYDEDRPFLDPYVDDVERRVVHHGPIVGWCAGDECAEITIRVLQLHDASRSQLIVRKIERISEVNDVLARKAAATSTFMRELLAEQLNAMQSLYSEYSAMVRAVCSAAETG